MIKYCGKDRYDSIMFPNKKFIHEYWRVSDSVSHFHIEGGGMDLVDKHGHRYTKWFGVSKQPWKASGCGIAVDGTFIGQYE